MRNDRREKLYKELRAPGTRRVLEALELVSEKMTDFEDEQGIRPEALIRMAAAT